MKHFIFMLFAVLLIGCQTSQQPLPLETSETNPDGTVDKVKMAKLNAQLGLAYLDNKNILIAKQKLLLSLDAAPNLPESLYSMAYFLEKTGNPREAEGYYLKAIAAAPKRGDTHNNYGTFLCRQGQYKQSIEQFKLAVKDANYLHIGEAYENAGLCALKLPARSQAIAYFQRAVEEDPGRETSLALLADLHRKGDNIHGA